MTDAYAPEEDPRTEEEFEAAARAEGWVPEEQFRGRGTWTDAKTFVLRGERIRPLLRAKNERLEGEVTRLKAQIETQTRTMAEQDAAIKAASNLARRADERGYKRALAELEAKRDAAIDEGDKIAVRQTQEEIDAMKDERRAADEPPPAPAPKVEEPPAAPSTQIHPDITAWIVENPWFNSDLELQQDMVATHKRIMLSNPGATMREQLDMSKARLMRLFPEKFAGPDADPDDDNEDEDPDPMPQPPARSARAPAVLPPSGRHTPPPQRDRSPWMRIENEAERKAAKTEFDRMVKNGADMTAEEYVEIYVDPHDSDPIAMRRRRAAT